MAIFQPLPQPRLDQLAEVSTDRQYLTARMSTHANPWLGDWPIPQIRAYQKGHEAGQVWRGKRLARVFRRDSNVVAALGQRTAPWMGCAHELQNGDPDLRAELEALIEMPRSDGRPWPGRFMLTRDTLRDVSEDLAMCGIAILNHPWTPRADGSAWDTTARTWDLESVEWDSYNNLYYARTREHGRVPIIHGDGRWTIIRANELHPHEHGAVIPLAIHVASRLSSIFHRNSASNAVGSPKLIGNLPPGVKVKGEDGIGAELEAALDVAMQGLATLVVSENTKVDKIEFNAAGMGQFFDGNINADRRDVFFALTGQDGSAQNQGGNYQKAQVLEAVLYSWVVADTIAGGSGLTTGLLRAYAAINRGDASLSPYLTYPLPDPDEDARVEAIAKRHALLNAAVKLYRENGFDVTQEFVATLAKAYRITVPPIVAKQLPELRAYHMRNALFTRDEFRADRGRPPLGGTEGAELIDEVAAGQDTGPGQQEPG